MSALSTAVVAVDVGTSAVRAALVSAHSGVLRSTRVSRAESVGGATYDSEALLRDVERAIAGLEVAGRPAALALSAHIGAVAVDAALRPVVPAGSWADVRGVDILSQLPLQVRSGILGGTGRPAITGGALALAASLVDRNIRSNVAAILSPKDLLVAQLTGWIGTDLINAAYTFALDVGAKTWSGVCEDVGVPPQWLPRLSPPDETVAELSAEAALRCGLAPGTPVVSGAPDGSAGLGILLGERRDAIGDVAGTTDVLGRLIDQVEDAPHGAVLNPALGPNHWVAGGATGMTGGAVARWRSLVGAVNEHELMAVPPGARGLCVFPSMSGSRFPRWSADELGGITGQTADHGPAEILRAAQEGASHVVREGVDLLDPEGTVPVLLAGGSAKSAHLVRLRAAVLGRQLLVSSDPDVTLAGTAGLALIGAGLVTGIDEARERLGIRWDAIDPDPAEMERYRIEHLRWKTYRDATAIPPDQ